MPFKITVKQLYIFSAGVFLLSLAMLLSGIFNSKHYFNKKDYARAVLLEPTRGSYHLKSGMAFMQSKNFINAEKEFDRALSLDPSDSYAHFIAGEGYLALGNKRKAYQAFRHSIELSPEYERDILNKIFVSSGEYPELKKVVPDNHGSKFIFAQFLNDNNLWKESKEQFKEILQMEPKPPEYYFYYMADSSVNRNDYKSSLEVWESCVAVYPDNLIARKKMAWAYVALNRYDEAQDTLNKVLTVAPNDIGALNQIGWIYYAKGEREKAIAHYNEIISEKRPDWQTYNLLARVYFYTGSYEESLINFKKAIQLNPNHAYLRYEAALLYFSMENYQQAILECRKSLQDDPKNTLYLKLLEQSMEKLSK